MGRGASGEQGARPTGLDGGEIRGIAAGGGVADAVDAAVDADEGTAADALADLVN